MPPAAEAPCAIPVSDTTQPLKDLNVIRLTAVGCFQSNPEKYENNTSIGYNLEKSFEPTDKI